jgi:two-component system response regulator LytT
MKSPKLNVVVVEDEAIIADHIMMTLRSLGFRPWGPAMSLEEAKGYIERGPVDLVLIDINLNGQHDGIELGFYLKKYGNIPHVFLTANTDEQTVQKAKQTVPMGFVVKPFRRDELYSSMEIALSNWEFLQSGKSHATGVKESSAPGVNPRFFYVSMDGSKVRLFADEVVFITSAHVYVEINVVDGQKYLVRASMNQILESLPSGRFVRIHRSHCVNISYAERFDGRNLWVNGQSLPVSKSYKDELVRKFPSLGSLSS